MTTLSPEQKDKIRKARNQYMREYRKREEVKERERQTQERYWLKKAQELEKQERGES